MKRLANILTSIFLLMGLLSSFQAESQSNYETPNEVISSLYEALEAEADTTRAQLMSDLFIDKGTIYTILQRSSLSSNSKGGGFDRFLKGSDGFYATHTMTYDEIERSIDYYVDLALVHSLVFQNIVEKAKPNTTYEQMLWFSFTLVYQKDRWYLTNVTWVNAFEDEDVNNAMGLDTLWHRVDE